MPAQSGHQSSATQTETNFKPPRIQLLESQQDAHQTPTSNIYMQKPKFYPGLLNHLNLHASNFYLNTLRPNHPLHQLNFNKSDPRNMKDTIFANTEYHAGISCITNTTTISDEIIKQSLKINHTKAVEDYLNSQDINELIGIKP